MDNTMQIPCFYCDGTGYAGDRQTDVDRWEPSGQCCAECQGTGVSSRVAGARNTSRPPYDALIGLRSLRQDYLKARRQGDHTPTYRWLYVENQREMYVRQRAAACRAVGGAR